MLGGPVGSAAGGGLWTRRRATGLSRSLDAGLDEVSCLEDKEAEAEATDDIDDVDDVDDADDRGVGEELGVPSEADCGSRKENESRLLPSADETLVGESSMGAMGLNMLVHVVSIDSGE